MPGVTLEAVWDVLKWVLLVLVAGFIGQFGKSFALRLLERRRSRRTTSSPDGPATPPNVEIERVRLEAQAKIEKKRAKAEVKQAKKADADRSRDDSGQSSQAEG